MENPQNPQYNQSQQGQPIQQNQPVPPTQSAPVTPPAASSGLSWIRWGIIAIVVILVIWLIASLVMHKTAPGSQSQQDTASLTIDSTNPLYSFALPAGWLGLPNGGGQGEQAVNIKTSSVFSVATIALPSTLASTTSLSQLVNPTNINQVIQSEFPGATTATVSSSTLGGEKAIMARFSATVTETINATTTVKSKPLTIVHYATLHNGVLYIAVFMTATSTEATSMKDFQTIAGSFTFKQ